MYYNVLVARFGLTGASRQKRYIAMLGDPDRSQEGVVLEAVPIDEEYTRGVQGKAIERLEKLNGKGSDYLQKRKKEEGTPPVIPKPNTFDRNIIISDERKDEVSKSDEFQKTKEKISFNNRTIREFEKNNTPILSGTTLVASVLKGKDSVKKSQKDIDTIYSQVMALSFRYYTKPDKNTYNEGIEAISTLNQKYKDAYKNNPQLLNNVLIKDPHNFFTSIGASMIVDSKWMDPTLIYSSEFVSNIVTFKSDEVTKTGAIRGRPFAVRIIGYTPDGSPIVDIEELSFHYTNATFKPCIVTGKQIGRAHV